MPVEVASQIALWVLCLTNLVLMLVLYRHFGLSAMASAAGHDNDGVPAGKPSPPVFLKIANDQAPALQETISGQWTMVFFGTPHCAPCVDAMDRLNQSSAELAGAGVRILAAINAKEDAVRKFQDKKLYRFEICVDPDGVTSVAWQVKVTPFVFLIAPDGRIQDKVLASSNERLAKFIDDSLALAADVTAPPLVVR